MSYAGVCVFIAFGVQRKMPSALSGAIFVTIIVLRLKEKVEASHSGEKVFFPLFWRSGKGSIGSVAIKRFMFIFGIVREGDASSLCGETTATSGVCSPLWRDACNFGRVSTTKYDANMLETIIKERASDEQHMLNATFALPSSFAQWRDV